MTPASAERGERLLLAPVSGGAPTLDTIHNVDLLTLCNALPPQSVDMILADLPYGTTACSWDEVIPFEPMWKAFKRVIKPRGAIVLTASQPFTSKLTCSNLEIFRYELIWDKSITTGWLDAKKKPMKRHENILVFSIQGAEYFPQMSTGNRTRKVTRSGGTSVYNKNKRDEYSEYGLERYPTSILDFPHQPTLNIHPSQKSLDLFEYLIRTYTRSGDVVLDPAVGSGTTAVAARNTGRRFICGDRDAGYVEIARKRLRDTDPYQDRHVAPNTVQMSLFAAVMP